MGKTRTKRGEHEKVLPEVGTRCQVSEVAKEKFGVDPKPTDVRGPQGSHLDAREVRKKKGGEEKVFERSVKHAAPLKGRHVVLGRINEVWA